MENYEKLRKIGDGTFGTVYLCRRKSTNQHQLEDTASEFIDDLVAIKKMKKQYHSWQECLDLREIRALKKLCHPNIVLLKEVIRESNNLYLVFEHMENNLYQIIRERTERFPGAIIKRIVSQILQGLAYIHKQGFFHRDIKPENLLCGSGSDIIKIADFGLIREIDSQPPFTDYVSTRWYRAPELLLHSQKYTSAIDIWALGCIVAELYTLRPLFPGRGELDQIYKISQLIGPPTINEWPEGDRLATLSQIKFTSIVSLNLDEILGIGSDEGSDFIHSMLKWVPSSRSDAKELICHKYLRE